MAAHETVPDVINAFFVVATIVGGVVFVRRAYKAVTGSVDASIAKTQRERDEWKVKHGLTNG
jgi:hypothetical protein